MASRYFYVLNKTCKFFVTCFPPGFLASSPTPPHPLSEAYVFVFSTTVQTFLTFPCYSSWLEYSSFLPYLPLNLAETYSPLWAQLLLQNIPLHILSHWWPVQNQVHS